MSNLFDTNAISELYRRRPNRGLVAWLTRLPRSEQFTSAVVAGELLAGARRSARPGLWLQRYEDDLLPRLTVLPFDLECARVYAMVRADLLGRGKPIGEADMLIAATALRHDLTLVTANAKHFGEVPELKLKVFKPGDQVAPLS